MSRATPIVYDVPDSAGTLLRKRLWHRWFSVNFAKFLISFSYRTPLVAASIMFTKHLGNLHSEKVSTAKKDHRKKATDYDIQSTGVHK